MVGSPILNVVLSASMSMLWTLVNSLQVITTMALVNYKMPANVYMVNLKLAQIASFEVIDPQIILGLLFTDGFTETKSLSNSWVEMGNDDVCVVNNLGMFFFFMLYLMFQIVLWMVLLMLSPCSMKIHRAEKLVCKSLFWSPILIVALEGYLDFGLTTLANLEDLKLVTVSDFVNLTVMVGIAF